MRQYNPKGDEVGKLTLTLPPEPRCLEVLKNLLQHAEEEEDFFGSNDDLVMKAMWSDLQHQLDALIAKFPIESRQQNSG